MTGESGTGMPGQGFHCLEEADRVVLEAAGMLRVVLERRDDRWTHAVEIGQGCPGRWVRVAGALDGESAPDRVIGPVYQEFHWQGGPGGGVGMLIGQSGSHHYSAVFAATRGGDEARLHVELADRCRTPVVSLAATYLVELDSGHLVDAGPGTATWSGGSLGGGRLVFLTDPPAGVALAEAGRRGARVQALAKIEADTATHRLGYHWCWRPAEAL